MIDRVELANGMTVPVRLERDGRRYSVGVQTLSDGGMWSSWAWRKLKATNRAAAEAEAPAAVALLLHRNAVQIEGSVRRLTKIMQALFKASHDCTGRPTPSEGT